MLALFTLSSLLVAQMAAVANAGVTVSTFAGRCGEYGFRDGGKKRALFASPAKMAFGSDGSLYISDTGNGMVRKVSPNGIVSTIAGNGKLGFQNGPGREAMFQFPSGIAVDAKNNVFVADNINNLVRKISADGTVTTFAGSGKRGHAGGRAHDAQFALPEGLAMDKQGNIYVADSSNRLIRKISPAGVVTKYAGKEEPKFDYKPSNQAQFHSPQDLAFDLHGNLYVADEDACLIRKVARDGTVTTIAGSDNYGYLDGPADQARFAGPKGIAVDPSGNIYVADTRNFVVRMITPDGIVSTIAGSGQSGQTNGPGHQASFINPEGIVYHKGALYVADSGNSCVRKITFDGKANNASRRFVSPLPIRYNKDKCAICLEDKHIDQEYYYCSEQCRNSFHADCLRDCEGNTNVKKCPMCRTGWYYDRVATKIPSAPSPKGNSNA